MNRYYYRHMPRINWQDNYDRKYDTNYIMRYCQKYNMPIAKSFEEFLAFCVRHTRQEWIERPFAIDDSFNIICNEDGSYDFYDSIWDLLNLPDSKFYKRHKDNWRVRVPKLTANNKEWENFYVTFPWIAESVITGKERYSNGAKLKMIPMFERIIEKEWPKEENHALTQLQIDSALEHLKAEKKENELKLYETLFRKKVRKKSGKPFKSGNKENTIWGTCLMDVPCKKTPCGFRTNICFTFEEDDSAVSIEMCEVIE